MSEPLIPEERARSGHLHGEAFCLMSYRCVESAAEREAKNRKLAQGTIAFSPAKTRAVYAQPTAGCGYRETIWNSRDGVTPFMINCRGCGGVAQHVEWTRDAYTPEYRPRSGERVFRDGTREEAAAIMRKRLKSARGTEYEVPEAEWPAYIRSIAESPTGEFQPGWPTLEEVR